MTVISLNYIDFKDCFVSAGPDCLSPHVEHLRRSRRHLQPGDTVVESAGHRADEGDSLQRDRLNVRMASTPESVGSSQVTPW